MSDAPRDPVDPDAALMVAFQSGDVTAFEQILDKYQRAIVNFIYKIVNNRAEAEELAQDVFLKVYRARNTYEPRARFSAWIYRIATNVGLKAAGRKRRSPFWSRAEAGDRVRNADEGGRAAEPDAEQQLVSTEIGQVVRQIIRGLPKNEKIAIILRRYEGLSYKEIADVMNCTEAAVKTYIHRGKLRVRERVLPYLKAGKI